MNLIKFLLDSKYNSIFLFVIEKLIHFLKVKFQSNFKYQKIIYIYSFKQKTVL